MKIRLPVFDPSITDVFVCFNCAIVDRSRDRCRIDTPCVNCGTQSRGGQQYLPGQIQDMPRLMQEVYYMEPSKWPSVGGLTDESHERRHYMAVAIYHSSYSDQLLGHLCTEMMIAQQIPPTVVSRLMDDHRFVRARLDKLFPSIFGRKWKAALVEVHGATGIDFQAIVDLTIDVDQKRNDLLHAGHTWSIPSDMPERCMRAARPLTDLFIALHNLYVSPTYVTAGRQYHWVLEVPRPGLDELEASYT